MARVRNYEEAERELGKYWKIARKKIKSDMVILHCSLCGKRLPQDHWMRYPSKGAQWLDVRFYRWYGRLLASESCPKCNGPIKGIDFYDCTEGSTHYELQKVYCKDCGCLTGTLHLPERFGAQKINGRWFLKIAHCRHCAFRARNWFLGPLAYWLSRIRERYV